MSPEENSPSPEAKPTTEFSPSLVCSGQDFIRSP
jgi:hypothetical protein